MSRVYRASLRTNGQTSPEYLSDYPIMVLKTLTKDMFARPVSYLDVGAGSGAQTQRIVASVGAEHFARRVSVDWSAKAIDLLNQTNIYDENVHTESNRLPFADKEFDFAVSIENLEHLYADAVIPAIEELKRVASYVIIVTPLPRDVINHDWLGREIPAALSDPELLDHAEYNVLEGCVHKSTVYPDSMEAAGFVVQSDQHGYYFGASSDIDTSKIRFIGLDAEPVPTGDLRDHYAKLLQASKSLKV